MLLLASQFPPTASSLGLGSGSSASETGWFPHAREAAVGVTTFSSSFQASHGEVIERRGARSAPPSCRRGGTLGTGVGGLITRSSGDKMFRGEVYLRKYLPFWVLHIPFVWFVEGFLYKRENNNPPLSLPSK